jgi:hypothetical protein
MALSWLTASTATSVSVRIPFGSNSADVLGVELMTRVALSEDAWVPDSVEIVTGRQVAIDRIGLQLPALNRVDNASPNLAVGPKSESDERDNQSDDQTGPLAVSL